MRKKTLWFYAYVGWEMLLDLKGLFTLHSLRLKEIRQEGENIKTFVFSQNKKAEFEAGQYGLWFMPKFIWGKPYRFFTVAASPTEDTLQISTRISNTDFKRKLAGLPVGSKVYMIGPIGRFVLGKKPPETAVLVAGGIGATPMRAIARFAYDTKAPVKLTLVHSADGYYLYQKEFEKYVPDCRFVTRDTFPQTLQEIAGKVPDDTPFYLSGPPAFVVSTEKVLKQLNRKNIRKDGFIGY